MRRYAVEYFQDCGYAGMAISVVIEAENLEDAEKNYAPKVRGLGYACTADGKTDLLQPVEETTRPLTKARAVYPPH